MITILLPLLARLGVPERIRAPVQYAALVIAAIALLWAGKALYDASVIEDHEHDRAVQSIDALDTAAEDRAHDAIINHLDEKDREDAIKAAPTGSAVSAPDLQLNCLRLRKLGRIPEPCRHISGD